MGDKTAVAKFLGDFKQKSRIFDILFLDDRGKNFRTLAKLELSPNARKKVLEDLKIEDYSEGPKGDAMYGGGAEMWVFGKIVRGAEVYIKITLGTLGGSVICISFHLSEHPMRYPFRDN